MGNMKSLRLRKGSSLFGFAGLLVMLGTGCAARTVEFSITRPALLNLEPAGNTISLGTIDPNGQAEAAAQVTAELRDLIAHSPNPSIHLVASGGVDVEGSIVADSYSESTETVPATCMQKVDDGCDPITGVCSSWHFEDYDCSYNVTTGTGASSIRLRIIAASDHHTILDQTYTSTESITNPSKADAAKLPPKLRSASVADFARVIVPWKDSVSERFKDCDVDSRCKQGLDRVKAHDLPGADAFYTEVIGAYATGGQVPENEAKRIGEAFYDRGVTRAHEWRYSEAIADMQKAIALQPKRAKWPQELASLQQLARDHQALRDQGAAQ